MRKPEPKVCEACGKKMKLICPNEWTAKDDKAFNLGVEDGIRIEKKRVLEILQELHDNEDSIFGSKEFSWLKQQIEDTSKEKEKNDTHI